MSPTMKNSSIVRVMAGLSVVSVIASAYPLLRLPAPPQGATAHGSAWWPRGASDPRLRPSSHDHEDPPPGVLGPRRRGSPWLQAPRRLAGPCRRRLLARSPPLQRLTPIAPADPPLRRGRAIETQIGRRADVCDRPLARAVSHRAARVDLDRRLRLGDLLGDGVHVDALAGAHRRARVEDDDAELRPDGEVARVPRVLARHPQEPRVAVGREPDRRRPRDAVRVG